MISEKVEEYAFGGLVAANGVFTQVDPTTIAARADNAVGPRAFPYAVGALLVATGLAAIIATARGKLGQAEEGEDVDADVRTLQGWRRELVGDELLALLRGERALAIDADLKVRVTERCARRPA